MFERLFFFIVILLVGSVLISKFWQHSPMALIILLAVSIIVPFVIVPLIPGNKKRKGDFDYYE